MAFQRPVPSNVITSESKGLSQHKTAEASPKSLILCLTVAVEHVGTGESSVSSRAVPLEADRPSRLQPFPSRLRNPSAEGNRHGEARRLSWPTSRACWTLREAVAKGKGGNGGGSRTRWRNPLGTGGARMTKGKENRAIFGFGDKPSFWIRYRSRHMG